MLRHKRKTQWVGLLLVVSFLTIILGAMLFLDTRPEFERVQSEDGWFTVEGELPSTVDVNIIRDQEASTRDWTAVVSDVYVVEPDGVLLPIAVTMRMHADGFDPPLAHRVGFFDTERGAWELLDTRYDEVRNVFEAETNHFSHWALLEFHTIDLTDTDREQLLADVDALAPPDTNSYRVDLAYATEDGDYVLFEPAAVRQVCPQPVTVRERAVMTSVDRALSLRIDGVERSANVRAIVTWELGSGCPNRIDPQAEQIDVL